MSEEFKRRLGRALMNGEAASEMMETFAAVQGEKAADMVKFLTTCVQIRQLAEKTMPPVPFLMFSLLLDSAVGHVVDLTDFNEKQDEAITGMVDKIMQRLVS